jgi:hypothetical protein
MKDFDDLVDSMAPEDKIRIAESLTAEDLIICLIRRLGWDRVTLQRAGHEFGRLPLDGGTADVEIDFRRRS